MLRPSTAPRWKIAISCLARPAALRERRARQERRREAEADERERAVLQKHSRWTVIELYLPSEIPASRASAPRICGALVALRNRRRASSPTASSPSRLVERRDWRTAVADSTVVPRSCPLASASAKFMRLTSAPVLTQASAVSL